MRLRVALRAVLLCHTLASCASPPRGGTSMSAAGSGATAEWQMAGSVVAADGGVTVENTVPLASDCDRKFCVASASKLSDYCDQENARCPADSKAAKALACQSRQARERFAFASSCGGNSVRIRYDYGALDYHYDTAGALRAVTTIVKDGSQKCEADIVMYGDTTCQAGALVVLTCP